MHACCCGAGRLGRHDQQAGFWMVLRYVCSSTWLHIPGVLDSGEARARMAAEERCKSCTRFVTFDKPCSPETFRPRADARWITWSCRRLQRSSAICYRKWYEQLHQIGIYSRLFLTELNRNAWKRLLLIQRFQR